LAPCKYFTDKYLAMAGNPRVQGYLVISFNTESNLGSVKPAILNDKQRYGCSETLHKTIAINVARK